MKEWGISITPDRVSISHHGIFVHALLSDLANRCPSNSSAWSRGHHDGRSKCFANKQITVVPYRVPPSRGCVKVGDST